MSDFDDAIGEMYGEAREAIGEERFILSGAPLSVARKFSATFNEVGTTSEPTLNGRTVTFSVVLQAAISEFAGVAPRAGQQVQRVKDGRVFRIVGEVHRDSLTFTFPLQTVQQ